MEVDLAAEQVFAAERGTERIVIKVKSFLGKSKLNDFYEAKGQYDIYRRGLRAFSENCIWQSMWMYLSRSSKNH